MELAASVLAELLAMVRKPKDRARVKAKATVQKCILCDDPADDGCRGLCEYHHNQFKYEKAKVVEAVVLTKKEKARKLTLEDKQRAAAEDWDKEQVQAGRIFESRRGRHSKRPNAFKETA